MHKSSQVKFVLTHEGRGYSSVVGAAQLVCRIYPGGARLCLSACPGMDKSKKIAAPPLRISFGTGSAALPWTA